VTGTVLAVVTTPDAGDGDTAGVGVGVGAVAIELEAGGD